LAKLSRDEERRWNQRRRLGQDRGEKAALLKGQKLR
jgi:hypothetical protein